MIRSSTSRRGAFSTVTTIGRLSCWSTLARTVASASAGKGRRLVVVLLLFLFLEKRFGLFLIGLLGGGGVVLLLFRRRRGQLVEPADPKSVTCGGDDGDVEQLVRRQVLQGVFVGPPRMRKGMGMVSSVS